MRIDNNELSDDDDDDEEEEDEDEDDEEEVSSHACNMPPKGRMNTPMSALTSGFCSASADLFDI